MKSLAKLSLPALLFAALLLSFGAKTASAHGHTDVGDYEVVIGFSTEPAYQGEPNGLELRISDNRTNTPVSGLADKLKAEIIYGASTKQLPVEAMFGEEGSYTAYVLPTEAGDYTWHITGDINGTPLDVRMSSSPDTFSSIEPKSVVSFPAAEPSASDLRSEVDAAKSSAQTALIVGGLGALLGIVGIVVGFLGLRARGATPAATTTRRTT